MTSTELTNAERVAILRTLEKQVVQARKDAEAGIRDGLLDMYYETGADRISLKIGAIEVGKASVVTARETAEVIPGREAEALAFLRSCGLTCEQPVKDWRGAFVNVGGRAVHAETGETCDAIEYRPSKAPYVRYSGLKAEDVGAAIKARGLQAADMLALMEGE